MTVMSVSVEELDCHIVCNTLQVMNSFTNKVPNGNGPMAEYNYWFDRENGLSILVEQLKTEIVKRIFSLLNKAKSQIPSGFNYYRTDLLKLFHEASDNVKFLYTISRHFKVRRIIELY